MTPSDRPLSKDERDQLEADHTFFRIVELRINPVRGSFDAAHLREVNRRIFQDLPELGFNDVTPGIYRPPVTGGDWVKHRALESTRGVVSVVAYSSMDTVAQAWLDKALTGANPAELGKLKTAEFTQTMGKLYAKLDYIHPFRDGNSRTLREFTRQLAEEAGYDIEWERFNKTPQGRDVLYVARDLSVNELASPHIKNDSTRVHVTLSMDQLERMRSLPELLRDVVRPSRAVAFEKLPEADARKQFPELAEAYETLNTASQYFAAKMPGNEAGQRGALEIVVRHVQVQLDQGETQNFKRSSQQPVQFEAP